jgi:hypothetical protein
MTRMFGFVFAEVIESATLTPIGLTVQTCQSIESATPCGVATTRGRLALFGIDARQRAEICDQSLAPTELAFEEIGADVNEERRAVRTNGGRGRLPEPFDQRPHARLVENATTPDGCSA